LHLLSPDGYRIPTRSSISFPDHIQTAGCNTCSPADFWGRLREAKTTRQIMSLKQWLTINDRWVTTRSTCWEVILTRTSFRRDSVLETITSIPTPSFSTIWARDLRLTI